jgi:hypothetical protein
MFSSISLERTRCRSQTTRFHDQVFSDRGHVPADAGRKSAPGALSRSLSELSDVDRAVMLSASPVFDNETEFTDARRVFGRDSDREYGSNVCKHTMDREGSLTAP